METNTKIQEKRLELSKLSRQAEDIREGLIRQAQEDGKGNLEIFYASCTINYLLLNHIYDTHGAKEFKTFWQWKKENATIKKGSKAFLIWGQPIEKNNKEDATEEEKGDEYRFFPLCFLFSDKQVVKKEDRKAVKHEEKEESREVVLVDEFLG